ncbi:amidohydrolase [Spirochaetia bacterium]|nr:amidohydrolase [Spirochaetia bacterium]
MTKAIYNARVYIERGVFCQALRIDDGRITRTGSNADILDGLPAGAEKIDAAAINPLGAGCLVIPAFHDSHLHLRGLGQRTGMIDGAGSASVEEVIRRGQSLVEGLKKSGQLRQNETWVQGAGVNPDLFSGEKRDLNREDMDKVSTEYPVVISRHCGHTIYCNSLALKMAGIGESAPDVEGGTIEKDADGRPTGVLRENAAALVRGTIPQPSKAEITACLKRGMAKALSLGITAVGSNDTQGLDFDRTLEAYRDIYESEGPHIRVSMQCGVSGREDILDSYLQRGFITGKTLWANPPGGNSQGENDPGDVFLKMGPLKLFEDGTLGGRTAWMRQPYHDKPETRGFPVMDGDFLDALTQKAAAGGMQVVVHAIGDAGVEAVLKTFGKVTGPGHNPLRHGVIHCQITDRGLLEKMARNNILALVQPIFLADDMYVLENRVGPELASSSYAWGSMEKLGIPASYGTDAPVSDFNPLLGISWAVRRQNPADGFPKGGFYPAERVDVSAAVDAYTAGAAWASFDENRLGRIKAGYLADLAFIDRDIFSIPPEDIHLARVVRTMVGGALAAAKPD